MIHHGRLPQIFGVIVAVVVGLLGRHASALPIPQRVVDMGATQDALVRAGYLPVTLYDGWNGNRVDPSGVADSTQAIQKAIEDGRESALLTYLPPGTYRVSDTLIGQQVYQVWNCADHFGKPAPGRPYEDYGTGRVMMKHPSLVGPSSGPRPVLLLRDNAPGFGDASHPKPMVRFYNDGPGYGYEAAWTGQSDCGMNFQLRNVELRVGNGNPGAIAVELPSAQWSSIQDVKVIATGGYAGFRGTPQTKTVVNVEVEGGRFGFILGLGSENLAGIVLRDQEVAGVVVSSYSPVSLIGFHIQQQTGAAIVVDNSVYNFANQGSQVSLIDGFIDVKSPTFAAIANDVTSAGSSLYMRNVFIRTGGNLVRSGSLTTPNSGGDISHVVEYVHNDPRQNGSVRSVVVVDGKQDAADRATIRPVVAAPSDLVARHTRRAIPWALDADVKSVRDPDIGAKGDGNTDDTAALQRAIDAHEKVFLPRGDYRVTGTLSLHARTQLVGVPGSKSRIYASWTPSTFAPVLRTDDSPTATTLMSDVRVYLPGGYEATTLSALEWRAGRQSVLNEFSYDLPWEQDRAGRARKMILAVGSGGGRWYNTMAFQQFDGRTNDPGFRALLVEGTSEPLTLYSLNAEYANSPMTEIRNAANVRIVGNKTEVAHAYLIVADSKNILHAGLTGHCYKDFGVPCQGTFNAVELSNVDDIALANAAFFAASHALAATVRETPANVQVSGNDNATLFKRGEVNDDVFPHCGDGLCEATERAGACAADCGDANMSAPPGATDAGPGVPGTGTRDALRPLPMRDDPTMSGECSCATVGGTSSRTTPYVGLAIALALVCRRASRSTKRRAGGTLLLAAVVGCADIVDAKPVAAPSPTEAPPPSEASSAAPAADGGAADANRSGFEDGPSSLWPATATALVARDSGGGYPVAVPPGSQCITYGEATYTYERATGNLEWKRCDSHSDQKPWVYVSGQKHLDAAQRAKVDASANALALYDGNDCRGDKSQRKISITVGGAATTYTDSFYACQRDAPPYAQNVDGVFVTFLELTTP